MTSKKVSKYNPVIGKHYENEQGQIVNLIQQLLNNKKSANHADIQELVKFYEEVSPPNNPSKNFSKTIS